MTKTKHQEISATVYREIFEELLSSLDQVIEENQKDIQLFKDHNLTDIPAYGAGIGKDAAYKAIKNRILNDLQAAQIEADEFEGFDA